MDFIEMEIKNEFGDAVFEKAKQDSRIVKEKAEKLMTASLEDFWVVYVKEIINLEDKIKNQMIVNLALTLREIKKSLKWMDCIEVMNEKTR